MRDLSSHLSEFREEGFTVFERFFDAGAMGAWKRRLHELADQVPSKIGHMPWFGNMVEHAPDLMLPAVTHPTLLDFAELVMGPFVQLDNLTLAAFGSVTPEQANGKVSGWHRDRWGQVPRGDVYERPHAINAISYLQDLTPAYGPLRVVPRSHRAPITMTPEETTRPRADERVIAMKAGDVVVIHNNLIHSGSPNTSGQPRYFFSIYLNLTWLRTSDDHSGPNVKRVVDEARRRNDHRTLRLFGVDEHLERRANSGFLQPDEPNWARWCAEDRAAVLP